MTMCNHYPGQRRCGVCGMNKMGGSDLDIPHDPKERAIRSTMSDVATYCLRGLRGCSSDEQYQEAHERVMKAMLDCYAMKISWQAICLAYQGDTKPCATPCLHCDRIEAKLSPESSQAVGG